MPPKKRTATRSRTRIAPTSVAAASVTAPPGRYCARMASQLIDRDIETEYASKDEAHIGAAKMIEFCDRRRQLAQWMAAQGPTIAADVRPLLDPRSDAAAVEAVPDAPFLYSYYYVHRDEVPAGVPLAAVADAVLVYLNRTLARSTAAFDVRPCADEDADEFNMAVQICVVHSD